MAGCSQGFDRFKPEFECSTRDCTCAQTTGGFEGCEAGTIPATEDVESEAEGWTKDRKVTKCLDEKVPADASLPRSHQGDSQEGAREVCCREEEHPGATGCSTGAIGQARGRRDGDRGDHGETEIEETMEPFVDTPEELAGLLGLPTPLPINHKAIYMGYTSIYIY